jgi:hypothetical protein
VSKAIDGTADDCLWQDVEDENVKCDCEEDKKDDNGEDQSENC